MRPQITIPREGLAPLSGRLLSSLSSECPRTAVSPWVICGRFSHSSSSISASTVSPTAARRVARRMSLRTAALAQAWSSVFGFVMALSFEPLQPVSQLVIR